MASHIRPGVSVPLNLSMATMPVGEVTLISVSHLPPITSMPTKSNPRRFSSGSSFAQISCSVAVNWVFGLSPDSQVRADLPFAGNAIYRASDLAVDQHDALVAFADFGKEFLQDMRLSI